MLQSIHHGIAISRKKAPRCSVWPAFFAEPLPSIPIPLAPPDPDITLDMQPLVLAVYARSRYERDIDYHQPLNPPLGAEDAAWLREELH
jgi:hypothetical protein